MPTYTSLPTQAQWLSDMKQTGIKSLTATKYGQATRIGEMLAELEGMDSRVTVERIELLAHILVEAAFLIKYRDREDKLGKSKLSSQQADCAAALRSCVEGLLNGLLGASDTAQLNQKLTAFLSKSVGLHEQQADAQLLTKSAIDWLTGAQVKALKLSFRAGLAHRKTVASGGIQLNVYDTDAYRDAIEVLQTSLFVMDEIGRIYVSGQQHVNLKHSSFLQGSPTKAAGTMRWENGQLKILTNQSGHYKPGLRQMLTVLERLQAYQVNLSSTTFYRANFTAAWRTHARNPSGRALEPCNALEMLRVRRFPNPGCAHPTSLCIQGDGSPA